VVPGKSEVGEINRLPGDGRGGCLSQGNRKSGAFGLPTEGFEFAAAEVELERKK